MRTLAAMSVVVFVVFVAFIAGVGVGVGGSLVRAAEDQAGGRGTVTKQPATLGAFSVGLVDPDGNPVLVDQHVPRSKGK